MLEQVKGKGTFVYEPHISHAGGDRPLSFAESLRMQHDDHTPAGDTFLQADLSEGLDKIFPEQNDWKTYRYPGLQHYEAVESWPNAEAYLPGGDRRALWNGDAHLRSTLIGGNQTFEVEDGKLQLNGLASILEAHLDPAGLRTRARHLADLVAEIKSDGTSEEDTNVGSEGGNSQAEDGGNAEGDNQAKGGNQAESGSNAEGGNA